MKFYSKILTVISVFFLIACSEDDAGRFTSVHDLAATTNADGMIQVNFSINAPDGVSHFSLAIVKSSQAGSFTAESFLQLEPSQITDVQVNGLEISVELKQDQLDSDGDPLEAGASYHIFIFSEENNYLSDPSPAFSYSVEEFQRVRDLKVTEAQSVGASPSTINVSFTTNSSRGVEEFRVLVAKFRPVEELSVNYILSLDEAHYTSVNPSSDNQYSISLDEGQLDTDGHSLVDKALYQIHVLAKGTDKPITASAAKEFGKIEVFNSVLDMWVHDIGNTQMASDLRVVFDVNASRGIDHLSILLTKETSISSLTLDKLNSLDESAFTIIPADGSKSFTVDLSEDQVDSDGDPLVHGESYAVKVFIEDLQHLSTISEVIAFRENGIYDGGYFGWFNDNLFQDIPFSLEIEMNESSEYLGPVFISQVFASSWGGETDGDTKMILDGNQITYWEYNQDLPDYKGGCPGLYTGTGVINDDYSVVIEFTGNDCDGYHEDGVITLERNWRH